MVSSTVFVNNLIRLKIGHHQIIKIEIFEMTTTRAVKRRKSRRWRWTACGGVRRRVTAYDGVCGGVGRRWTALVVRGDLYMI